MISLGHRRRGFRLSLTPMIDVVFLLLVFFMLAARFGTDDAIDISTATSGGAYDGAPRLVTIAPEAIRLNGTSVPLEALAGDLSPLMQTSDDVVALRPVGGVPLQGLVDVMTTLREAGIANLVVVE